MAEDKDSGDLICAGCGSHVDGNYHSCPYQEDIYDNPEDFCNCCGHCMESCCQEI